MMVVLDELTTIYIHDRHIRIIATTTTGEILRDFQLDPTRKYQPHNRRNPNH